MLRKITCLCEANFETEIPEKYDLDADALLGNRILDGSFLAVRCPECGIELKSEYPVQVDWPSKKLELYLVPEIERTSFMNGQFKVPKHASVAIGYGEIAEKYKIALKGLDEKTVEMMKYYLHMKAEESSPEGQILVRFSGEESGSLVFTVEGLKPGEVALAKMPKAQYEKIRGELAQKMNEEPFADMLSGQYVSVQKVLGH